MKSRSQVLVYTGSFYPWMVTVILGLQSAAHPSLIRLLHVSGHYRFRIRNLSPYFTLHVDSTLNYGLEINKNPSHYYWFLTQFSPWSENQ